MQRGAVIALCLLPLAFAVPTLNEPWGNSEESLNAAIWALGARNLIERGVVEAHRGTLVAPHGGTKGDGIYAHHPPLVVWLSVLPVALSRWEGGPRLCALACVVAALALLWMLLRRHFEVRAALAALAVAAASTYALRYGRLLTTVTLCAPLFLGGLLLLRSRWLPLLVALLVLSSWEGVACAAVLAILSSLSPRRGEGRGEGAVDAREVGDARVTSRGGDADRKDTVGLRLPPHPRPLPYWGRGGALCAFVVSLFFVVWHLVEAAHGINELIWQFKWRSAGDEITVAHWLTTQLQFVGEGLGPLALLALLAAPFFLKQEQRLPYVLLLVPGLVMELVFRQGASKHAFWGYNLVFPAAFAVAAAVQRVPRLLPLVALQLAATLFFASHRLIEEHEQNALGEVAKTLPQHTDVPVFSRRSFHPYVSWYASSKPQTVRTLSELSATTAPQVLTETRHAKELGCTLKDETPNWQLVPLEALRAACPIPQT